MPKGPHLDSRKVKPFENRRAAQMNGYGKAHYGMRMTVRIWKFELFTKMYWPSTMRHS
jgi:hypothetical protein